MEIWFLSAIAGAVLTGLSNFFFKQAAVRAYNAELFVLYGSFISVTFTTAVVFFSAEHLFGHGEWAWILFLLGLVSSGGGMLKIYALRHIDSTIYFPLFKLLAPSLAIVAGIIFFKESFSSIEWFGMMLGLLVPLMLITKSENHRQNNLLAGLFLILITGIISAASAIGYKFAIDASLSVNVSLLYTAYGIACGSMFILLYKNGFKKITTSARSETSAGLVFSSVMRAVLVLGGVWFMLYAFANGGTLAVVQTIHSMYILIPIVLAIIFYNEHWNTQKVIAIVLSVAALGLLQ